MTEKLYIPYVGGGPTPPPGSNEIVEQTWMENKILDWMRADSRQGREEIIKDPLLKSAACNRVYSMAKNRWHGHVDPEGRGPDWYVRNVSYALPSWYYVQEEGDRSNHVESISYGGNRLEKVENQTAKFWQLMLNDPSHRVHILGEETFATQTNIGICAILAPQSEEVWYLSIITAPPPVGNKIMMRKGI